MHRQRQAQEAVLQSLLDGSPLPGTTEPLSVPDLAGVDRDALRLVVSDTLAMDPAAAEVIVADHADSDHGRPEVEQTNEQTYELEFLPPEVDDGLHVRLRVSLHDPARGTAALGEVLVGFREKQDGLVVNEGPVHLAV